MAYSYQGDEEKTAKATSKDINVSWKQCNEVCYNLKNKKISAAEKFLERVLDEKDFIRTRRYNTSISHRTKGQPGRYFPKAVKIISQLLQNAKANAEFKGLDVEKMKIVHATAYKTSTIHRIRPKGRAKTSDIDLAAIEIVIKEV